MNPWTTAVMTASLVGCLSLTACVSEPPIAANPANPIRTVALLPLINDTNDVDGPIYAREKLIKELERYHYAIKPLVEADQLLKDQAGITLGSQLDLTTPKKLCEILGVDGVFYGSLDDFSRQIAVTYNMRRVRIRTKLVDCRTGQTVWKNGIGVKQEIVGTLGTAPALAVRVQDERDKGEGLRLLLGEAMPTPWFRLPTMQLLFAPAIEAARLVSSDTHPLKNETQWAVEVTFKGVYPPIETQCSGGSQPTCSEVLSAHYTIKYGTPLPPGPGN